MPETFGGRLANTPYGMGTNRPLDLNTMLRETLYAGPSGSPPHGPLPMANPLTYSACDSTLQVLVRRREEKRRV